MSVEIQLEEPISLRSLHATGEALSGLEGAGRAFPEYPRMAEAIRGHHEALFFQTIKFVYENPELHSYYTMVIGNSLASGRPHDELKDEDDTYFEACLFMDLFYPEEVGSVDEPTLSESIQSTHQETTNALYIDGKLFTRDEAVALFTKLLHEARGPIKPAKLREQGLERFVHGTTQQATHKMATLRKKLRKHLTDFFGSDDMFLEDGNTKARTYELRLGNVTLLSTIEATLVPEEPPTVTVRTDETKTPPATIAQPATDKVATHEPNPTLPETNRTLWIRGSEYSFSSLERKIIDAILAGNHSVGAIIGHIQDGDRYAPADFFKGEFLPALDNLSSFTIGSERLITVSSEQFDGRTVNHYHLPENARIETYRRQNREVLRFLDPSIPKADRLQPIQATTPPTETPRRRQAAPKRQLPADMGASPAQTPKQEVLPIIYSDKKLQRENGTVIELELPERKLLEILLEISGSKRATVQELVKALGYDHVDSTVSSIVADDLSRLQSKIDKEIVKRKQKSNQPARWWIDMTYVTEALPS